MPIYAYRCSNCGHAQDVLQRMSDPVLTVCPACGQSTYVKQVTAAGFQLKGSGWYVTDFRDGKKAAPAADADKAGAGTGEGAAEGKSGGEAAPAAEASAKKGEAANNGEAAKKPEAAPSASAAPSPAPAPAAPAGGKAAD